jgi:hypothetical protein
MTMQRITGEDIVTAGGTARVFDQKRNPIDKKIKQVYQKAEGDKPKEYTVGDVPKMEAPKMPDGTVAPTVNLPTGTLDKGVIDLSTLTAPQAAVNQEFRTGQSSLAQQLAAQAAGQGPSLATEQFKQAQQANQAAAFAQLASARGGANPALARQTMRTSQDIQAQTARDAAMARMQEQMSAREQLAGVLGQARQGDIATGQMELEAGLAKYKSEVEAKIQQGQLDQRTGEAMYQAQVQKSMQDAQLASQFQGLQQQYIALGMDAQKANMLASLELEKLKMDAKTMPVKPTGYLGQIGGIIGTAVGGYFGGPQGAAAGGAAGKQVGRGS